LATLEAANTVTQSTVLKRLDSLHQHLSVTPNNLNLLAEVSDLSLEAGKLSDALTATQKGLELDPSSPYFLLRLSSVNIAQHRYEDSIQVTEALIKSGHSDLPIVYNHAYAMSCLNRFTDARNILLQHAQMDSMSVKLLMRAHHYLGELSEAIAVAEHYLQRFPDDSDILGTLSLLYADTDQMLQASHASVRALQSDPNHLDALLTSGIVALAEEDAIGASIAARRALEVQPHNGRAWMIMGLMELLQIKPLEALPHLNKASIHQPQHIGTWHLIGWTHFMLGDTVSAENCFRQALMIDENFGESHGAMAALAALKGDWNTAESEAKIARRLDPKAMSAHYPRLIAAQRSGRHDLANEIVQRALQKAQSPKGDSIADMLNRIRTLSGKNN
jgi:tetratricopeptide (TPR) repeat protein